MAAAGSLDGYKCLGLSRGAAFDEVKAAYKQLARLHHPDKGGDGEKFKEITAAFEAIKGGISFTAVGPSTISPRAELLALLMTARYILT